MGRDFFTYPKKSSPSLNKYFFIMKQKIIYIAILLIPALLVSACGSGTSPSAEPTPVGTYRIDPIFWEFYNQNGGEDRLGPAITTLVTFQGKKMQYLENGLLVLDPSRGLNHYYFAPLGEELKFFESPNMEMAQQGGLIINGYQIHPDLVNLYYLLGPETVGAPLTNPQINYAQNRVEQHFQNLGFYYLLDDPTKEVHLLAYGLAVCNHLCQMQGKPENMIIAPNALSGLFKTFQEQVGASATGNLIVGPFVNDEGRDEVIFENMVVYKENGNVSLKPTVQLLGYEPHSLTTSLNLPIVVFYYIEEGWGHNILIHFDEFIIKHGGYEISGPPITEIIELNKVEGIIRQCFTNYCLDYYTNEAEAQVRPVPLGTDYKNTFYPYLLLDSNGDTRTSIRQNTTPQADPQSIFEIRVWESSPLITSAESQTISASVFFKGIPQINQQLTLYFHIPKAQSQAIEFPVTTEYGLSTITLSPIEESNGTLVTYEVCLDLPEGDIECAGENFLIWGNP